jgi:hypothetical protein
MVAIPDSHIDILDKKAFAHLCTLMPDGSPQSSPVWVTHADGMVIVNSAKGRRKDKNIDTDPRVAVSITDPENSYRALMVRGRVVKVDTDGADAQIDALAKKYLDADSYPYRTDTEVRVTYFIEPDKVSVMG